MWLGDDEHDAGIRMPAAARARMVSSTSGWRASMGWAIRSGCWRSVRAARRRRRAYTRNAAPFLGEIATGADGHCISGFKAWTGSGARSASGSASRSWRRRPCRSPAGSLRLSPAASAALTVATPFLQQGRRRRAGRARRAVRSAGWFDVPGAGRRRRRRPRRVRRDDELNGFRGGRRAEWPRGRRRVERLRRGRRPRTASMPTTNCSGFGADDELDGFAADEDAPWLRRRRDSNGFAATDLDGFADDELEGLGDEDSDERLRARPRRERRRRLRPRRPRETPAFSPSPNAPMWAPLW